MSIFHLGQLSLEFRLIDNLDVEEHLRVVLAAKLGALTVVATLNLWSQVDVVGLARDHVQLLQEGWNPEGVNDVAAIELQGDRLASWQVQGWQFFANAFRAIGVQVSLFARVVLLSALVAVVEVPRPLLGSDVYYNLRINWGVDLLFQVVVKAKEDQNKDQRNGRVEDLQWQVVAQLTRVTRIVLAAAV